MGENRLSSLAMMHVHEEIDISPEEIVNEFVKKHQHRLGLKLN